MSEEQLKAFLEKCKTDTSLQEKLKGAADADATLAIAQEAGFAITAEDIQSMQSPTVLSDDELEAVAGGAYTVWNAPAGPAPTIFTNCGKCHTSKGAPTGYGGYC